MAEGKITERTLYPPINKFLGELGFQSVSEIKFKTGQLDILAKIDDKTLLLKLKLEIKLKN
ncbi:MAG TPA: hypothetical protein PLC38_09160 [Methanobacterium sp.]|jgi:hypothetical protein|nr:MAG: hypothetical protein FGO69_00135 [Methanobacterium sp.]HOI72430.1 hypothetical protein [Methanobacterium sp.]